MTVDTDEVERLRRVAYGPGASAADRAAAEAALRALAEQVPDAGDAAGAEPVADGEVLASLDVNDVSGSVHEEVDGGGAAQGEGDGDDAKSVWERRIGVGWLVPVVIASITVGAVGALAATGQLDGWPEQISSLTSSDGDAPDGADTAGPITTSSSSSARRSRSDPETPMPPRPGSRGLRPTANRTRTLSSWARSVSRGTMFGRSPRRTCPTGPYGSRSRATVDSVF